MPIVGFTFLLLFLGEVASAVCSGPTGIAGQLIYNKNYHVAQYCDGTTWISMGKKWTGSNTMPQGAGASPSFAYSRAVWAEGSFVFITGGLSGVSGGIAVYSFDGVAFTLVDENTTQSVLGYDIWGDGTYIYVADQSGGIDVYSFNGAALTYHTSNSTNSTNATNVWGDGTYIYVADSTGGIDVYDKFNGTSLVYRTTDVTNTTNAQSVWGDGTYIYVADFSGGIDVYEEFNGTSLVYRTSNTTNTTGAYGVWSDGTYVYVADSTNVDVYDKFNGTTLNYRTTATIASSNYVHKIRGDGTYLYVADISADIDAYVYDRTNLIYKASNGVSNSRGLFVDSNYFYVAHNLGGTRVYSKLGCFNANGTSALDGTLSYNPDWRVMQYCDGQTWRSAGPPKRTFSPAITFDGTNDFLLRGGDLTTSSDVGIVSGSLWFRRNGSNGVQQVLYCSIDTAGSCRFQIDLSTGNTIHFLGKGTGGGTTRLNVTGNTAITDTNWHHLMFAIDLASTTTRSIYLDGVAESPTWATYSTGTVVDFTRTEHSVGAFTDGTGKFKGDVDDLWLDIGTYLDLSLAPVRGKFRDPNGNPIDLGATGSSPAGTAPEVYLSSRDTGLGSWSTNKGSGGNFTVTGGLSQSDANLPNLTCNHMPSQLNFKMSSSSAATDIWGDGTYLYETMGATGVSVYLFNGSTHTLKSSDSTHSTNARGVWGDGNYIYVADAGGGIDAYSFNGTTLTYITSDSTSSTGSQALWGDGNYIYVADTSGGLDVYTFNGSAFTLKATNTTNSTFANGVWGDGGYIYVADMGSIDAYTFDGTTLSFKGTRSLSLTSSRKVWGDGTYIYSVNDNKITAYTFNGTTFTERGNSPLTNGNDIWGDGTYLYIGDGTTGIHAYTFDGTSFWLRDTDGVNALGELRIWGDGHYVYVANWGGGSNNDIFQMDFGKCLCTNPAGKEGQLKFNSAYSVLQYCNGQNWIKIGK
jgi:hypothetical protein